MQIPKVKVEHLFLLFMVIVLLWASMANLWDFRLNHTFPYGYLAGDAFQHWVRADGIKDAGSYRFRADFQSYGYKDVIGDYPPVLFHLAIIFSSLSGLATYDSIYFLVFAAAIAASLLMYSIIRDFNRHIAIIALPFTILLFAGASYSAFTWGHWPSVLSQFFLIAMVWSLHRLELKRSYLLLAAFFSASLLTHTSEAIIGFLFILAYGAALFFQKKEFRENAKKILAGLMISALVSFYYLIIFKVTWAKFQAYSFSIVRATGGSPSVQLWDLGIFSILILAGALIAIALLSQKQFATALIASLFFLIIGYTNYIGFHSRAFQIRFFWPLYLAPLLGTAIYFSLKLLIKSWKTAYSYGIAALLLVLLLNVANIASALPWIPSYKKLVTPGSMDPYHWEAYEWIQQNTKKDAKIVFLYGDPYAQTNYLLSIKRVPYKIDENDFFPSLQKNESERYFVINIYGDNVNSYPYWKGFLGVGYHLQETKEFEHGKKKDLCSFDYVIYDKLSVNSQLPLFNLNAAGRLKQHGAKEVFANQVVAILNNPDPGGECV